MARAVKNHMAYTRIGLIPHPLIFEVFGKVLSSLFPKKKIFVFWAFFDNYYIPLIPPLGIYWVNAPFLTEAS
jgi:hypothetical protein